MIRDPCVKAFHERRVDVFEVFIWIRLIILFRWTPMIWVSPTMNVFSHSGRSHLNGNFDINVLVFLSNLVWSPLSFSDPDSDEDLKQIRRLTDFFRLFLNSSLNLSNSPDFSIFFEFFLIGTLLRFRNLLIFGPLLVLGVACSISKSRFESELSGE